MKHIVANRFLFSAAIFLMYISIQKYELLGSVFVLRQRGEIRRLLITLSLYVSPYLRLKLNIFFQIEAFCARCAGKGLIRYALRHSYFPHFS